MTLIKNFQPVERDRLFFDRYTYSVCFKVFEAGCLRANSNHKVLANIQWRNHARKQWNSGRDTISEATAANLLDMWEHLDQFRDSIKINISYDHLYVYCNDPAILNEIVDRPYISLNYAQEALVTKPKDVIVKRNPKFKFRSYFRDISMEPEEQKRLHDFITTRPESYGISNSFRIHLNRQRWFWLARHQWVEHNSPADITMLSLVAPGLIRKTLPVQAK